MIRCYIGLGSNQGDSRAIIVEALEMINGSEAIEITGVAPMYRTVPQGYLEQDDFINTVAELNTTLSPDALLSTLQQIEIDLGRVRTIRWGPRTVDLDLLLYGNETINLPQLQVPHPRMHQRAFVMVPLADLNKELQLFGARVSDTAKRLAGEQGIVKLGLMSGY